MTMKVTSIYRPIFRLSIYHNYFLNDGTDQFISMNDEAQQRQLKKYQWQDFMEIVPSAKTKAMLQGQLMVVKQFPDQLLIALKVTSGDERVPYISLSSDQDLVFKLRFKDPFFDNYTQLEREGELLYFSNKTPVLPAAHDFRTIHSFNQQATVTDKFLFGGDNKTELLQLLGKEEASQTDGILHLFMQGDNSNKSLINNDGRIKSNIPHFKIQFDNQKTIWKYIHKREGFETETKQEWPLTRYGYIPLDKPSDFKSPPPGLDNYKFPNPNPTQIKFIANKSYSEIFI